MRLGLGDVVQPGVTFIGCAGVVDRPLLLDSRCRIQVGGGGVPLLHVLDGELRGNTGVERSLGLLLVHLLNLPRI